MRDSVRSASKVRLIRSQLDQIVAMQLPGLVGHDMVTTEDIASVPMPYESWHPWTGNLKISSNMSVFTPIVSSLQE